MNTQAQADRRFRESLEERAIDQGRHDVVGGLNKLAVSDMAKGRPGLSSYVLAMLAHQGHARHVRQLNKAHDLGDFDRLHPDSPLRRASSEPEWSANDQRQWERHVTRPSPFEDDAEWFRNRPVGPRDSGAPPKLRAERVPDESGDVHTLTVEGMAAAVAAAGLRRYY